MPDNNKEDTVADDENQKVLDQTIEETQAEQQKKLDQAETAVEAQDIIELLQ